MPAGAGSVSRRTSSRSSGSRLSGRAFPFLIERVDGPAEMPYHGLLRALDAVPSGSVVVIPGGRAADAALFGELMATACLARGAVGAVCEGFVRDLAEVRALGFPLFACGTVPYDMDGRLEVVGHGRAVEVDGVTIEPGALIVADEDGVVVVPPDVEADVLAAVADKAARETVPGPRSPPACRRARRTIASVSSSRSRRARRHGRAPASLRRT